jgi:hypothetical protein
LGRPRGSKNRRSVTINSASAQTAQTRFAQVTAFPIDDPSVIEVNSPAVSVTQDAQEKERIASAVAKVPEIFTPEQVAWLFDAYAALLSFTYSLLLKVDYKAISEELEFSESEKEHMSKPLARILSKYCPTEWAGMSAEIELITGLGIWTVSSFARAKNVAVKQAEEKRQKNQTRPVEPMRRQGEILTPA